MKEELFLSDIKPGEQARVTDVLTEGTMGRRLRDLGLVENAWVRCLYQSPLGDPKAYLICGAIIALRNRDCRDICVAR